jgi:hypothetical protein
MRAINADYLRVGPVRRFLWQTGTVLSPRLVMRACPIRLPFRNALNPLMPRRPTHYRHY